MIDFKIETIKVDENYKYEPPTHFDGVSIMNVWEWPPAYESKNWTGYIERDLRNIWGSLKEDQQRIIAKNALNLFNKLGPIDELPRTREVKC